ncbi:MAG TPA: hypothetical protein DCL31_15170 [Clostridium sp.]|nr:hypothetical protein [Clostridium sp.]
MDLRKDLYSYICRIYNLYFIYNAIEANLEKHKKDECIKCFLFRTLRNQGSFFVSYISNFNTESFMNLRSD